MVIPICHVLFVWKSCFILRAIQGLGGTCKGEIVVKIFRFYNSLSLNNEIVQVRETLYKIFLLSQHHQHSLQFGFEVITSEELTSFWVWDWHIYENHLSYSDCTDSPTLSSARAMDQMHAVKQSKGCTFRWKQAEAAALTGIKQRIEQPVIVVPTADNCPLMYYLRGLPIETLVNDFWSTKVVK